MAYSITGEVYRKIAERKFAATPFISRPDTSLARSPFSLRHIEHARFTNFGIVRLKADVEQDIAIKDVTDKEHVSLHFQLHGDSKASFRGIDEEQPLMAGEYNMYYAEDFRSDLLFKAKKGFEYLAVILRTEYLLSLLEQAGSPVKQLEERLQARRPFALADKAMPISPGMNKVLYSVMNNPVADDLSALYYGGKIAEIVALQLSQYNGGAGGNQAVTNGKQLEEVHAFILDNYLSIHSLDDLANNFTLSPNQLKQGLKAKYGTTLYELVHRQRMLHAAHLLQHSDMNVNQVALETGYANAANFIQAFKKVFHTTPKKMKSGKA